MDQHRFAALTRMLTSVPSRRDVLRGLVGAGLGLGALRLQEAAEAKKKRKKKNKKKKPAFNAFGCLDVGQSCRGNSGNCCSGICEGKKPKKGKKDTSTCVAHNAGICSADIDSCAAGVTSPCDPSNFNNPYCICVLTTGNAGFCGAFSEPTSVHCRVCSKDTDCQAEFGLGAACVVLGGVCTRLCAATSRTACLPPCA